MSFFFFSYYHTDDDAEPYARRLIRSVYAASWDGPTMQLHFCKLSAMFFDVPGRARSSIFGPESERGGAPLRLFVGNFPEVREETSFEVRREGEGSLWRCRLQLLISLFHCMLL